MSTTMQAEHSAWSMANAQLPLSRADGVRAVAWDKLLLAGGKQFRASWASSSSPSDAHSF